MHPVYICFHFMQNIKYHGKIKVVKLTTAVENDCSIFKILILEISYCFVALYCLTTKIHEVTKYSFGYLNIYFST